MDTESGQMDTGVGNVWLTENVHKIRIVIDGNTQYVNNNRKQILEALKKIIGSNIVWIDSVGHYTSYEGVTDKSKWVVFSCIYQ